MIFRLVSWKAPAMTSLAALIAGAIGAWQVNDAFDAKTELGRRREANRALQSAMRHAAEADRISAAVGRTSAERQVLIRTQIQEVVREVPRFVTIEADRDCTVPRGFVRVHDSAASGTAPPVVPDPASPPHDAPSGVALSAVAATVAENYGTCRAEIERLTALQGWIAAQSVHWDGAPNANGVKR